MNKNEILETLKAKKNSFNISNFILFGSYANGTNHKESDVDIAFILQDGCKLSFDKYLQLEDELTKSFKAKIDLMNFKKLNPLIKMDAQKDFIYV